MNKVCSNCKLEKPLDDFFQSPNDAAANWKGTSQFCKQCHSEGKIKHGYGYYVDKWKSPSETK